MTDFYALLKQSILDRGIRSAKEREGIYAQARRAVIKQLWDYRPPLAAHEIDTRVGAYDTAVERIEADLQLAFADSKALAAARRSDPPAAPAEPEPAHDDDLPPFTDWLMDEPEYERGIERSSAYAPPATRKPTSPATRKRAPQPEPEPDYEEEAQPLAYDGGDDDEPHDGEPPRRGNDRWSEPEPDERAPGVMASLSGWLGTGEQLKIRLLAVAIGVLFIALVGIGAYFLGARNNDNSSVTLGIGVRREVSDAATAARIPTDIAPVAQTYAIFDGHDPTVFSTTPDDPIHFDSAAGVARIASSASASGVKVVIGPGLAARLAGQRVRVVIVARSSTDNGAANMRFAYQSGLAISHWQTANLDANFASVGMEWRLPTMRTSPTGDYLLIEPGIPGDGSGADIQSIKIDVLAS
jgi:hypothetical protein